MLLVLTLAVEFLLLTIIFFAALPLLRDVSLAYKVQWDRSPDFTSGANGQADGHAFVDATQTLCSTCVESFSLGNLTLKIDGSIDFFGRLNAGNRILVNWLLRLHRHQREAALCLHGEQCVLGDQLQILQT